MQFDIERYEEWVSKYKDTFDKPIKKSSGETWWQGERYKWIAVKHFQANWNIDSPNLAEMLESALSKTLNLQINCNEVE